MSLPSSEVSVPDDFRTVAHNVVHLRKEPRSGTELVSQTLLGRTVQVLKTEAAWSWVETEDRYRGWLETRWLVPSVTRSLTPLTAIFTDLREAPDASAPLIARLPLLNTVTREGDADGWTSVLLPDGETRGFLPTSAFAPLPTIPADSMGAYASERGRDFRGTPYLWGGSSSFGLDCSGFVQLCYRLAGMTLRRDADIQRDDPRFFPVETSDLVPGDLVFFGKPERITHIGMAWEPGTFLHSAGGAGVIVSPIVDDRYWPTFVDARRLDPARAHEPVTRFEAEDR